ncbi:MAG: hypothetical protein HY255_04990 [Betaproteobacteria bacterium]|nr:hypothetical protein [Betaproteobacteria bacterium]
MTDGSISPGNWLLERTLVKKRQHNEIGVSMTSFEELIAILDRLCGVLGAREPAFREDFR